MQEQIQKEKFRGNTMTKEKMQEILKNDLTNLSGLIYLMLTEETVLNAMGSALWEVHQRDEKVKQEEIDQLPNDEG